MDNLTFLFRPPSSLLEVPARVRWLVRSCSDYGYIALREAADYEYDAIRFVYDEYSACRGDDVAPTDKV